MGKNIGGKTMRLQFSVLEGTGSAHYADKYDGMLQCWDDEGVMAVYVLRARART